MRLNSKVTWGLAWAGLAVVLAVPSADYITGAFGTKANSAAVFTSTTDPVTPAATAPATAPSEQKTAEVTTTITKTGVTITPAAPVLGGSTSSSPSGDPVNKYLSTGKTLPDYISGGDSTTASASAPAPAAPAPKVVTPTAPVIDAASSEEPTQVATAEPTAPVVAPVPFPGRPADVAKPKVVTPEQAPVIVDETALATQQDTAPPTQLQVPNGPVPPAGIADDWRAQRQAKITRYLERNGLLDDGSTASVTVVPPPSDSDYDPNGFYLSDGPNNARAARRARIEQMLQDDGDDSDVTWF